MKTVTNRTRKPGFVQGGIAAACAACGWVAAALAFPTSTPSPEPGHVSSIGPQPLPAAFLPQVPLKASAAERFKLLRTVPADAVPGVIAALDPVRDLALMRVLLRRLAESDARRAMKVLATLDLAEEQNVPDSMSNQPWMRPRDFLMNAILSVWAVSDATASDAWIRENVRPPIRLELETVKVLAEADASRTAKTLLAVSRPRTQAHLMAAVFAPLLRQPGGPAECQALALGISQRIPQSGVLEGLFQRWNQTDPAAALAWADNLPDDLLNSKATAGLELLVGKVSPKSGLMLNLRMLSGQIDSEAFRDLFQKTIDSGFEKIRGGSGHANFAAEGLLENFTAWAAQDPTAAKEWITAREGTPASMAMEAQIPAALIGKSTGEATAALNALSPELQAGSAKGLARAMLGRGSGGVVELAAGIDNPQARDSYLETAFSQMAKYDRTTVAGQLGLISNQDVRRRLEKLLE